MRTARGWSRSLAILTFLTLSLTSCLKLDMALTVSSDDTVDGALVFAVNKELLELTGQSVDDFLGQTQVPSDVPGASQEPYEDDRFVGTKVVFDSVPLAELQQGSATDSLSIVREGDRFEVSGVLDLSTADQELQGNPFEGQIQEAFDTAELRVAVTFPGEVIQTNGQVEGTTVVWEPKFGVRTKMTAVASATGDGAEAAGEDGSGGSEASGGDSGGTTLLWVILGLALIAGLVALFLVMRRGRSAAGAPPAPGAGLPGVAAAAAQPGEAAAAAQPGEAAPAAQPGEAAPALPPAEAATAPIPPAPAPPAAPPSDPTSGEGPAATDDTTEPIGNAGAEGDPTERPTADPDDAPR